MQNSVSCIQTAAVYPQLTNSTSSRVARGGPNCDVRTHLRLPRYNIFEIFQLWMAPGIVRQPLIVPRQRIISSRKCTASTKTVTTTELGRYFASTTNNIAQGPKANHVYSGK